MKINETAKMYLMLKIKYLVLLISFTYLMSCNSQPKPKEENTLATIVVKDSLETKPLEFDKTTKTIHIFVALCDNKYQGIVPVPSKIGNGQDPYNNLYWGTAYGIKTYFKRSKEWKLLKTQKVDNTILERLIFKHKTKNYYIVADAYNGKYIKQTTKDFLKSSSGLIKDTLKIGNTTIGIKGNAKLAAYIGHDGLMDFQLTETYKNKDQQKRDVIILACYSKSYFAPHLKNANINPLVWTTGLMAPEAYTIHDALTGYINNETNEEIRSKAALAYANYQNCSKKAARNLLVTNW